MNKDFYKDLPGWLCVVLEKKKKKYGNEPWFDKALEEYRQHIKNSSMDDMKMPGYVFNKYINNNGDK